MKKAVACFIYFVYVSLFCWQSKAQGNYKIVFPHYILHKNYKTQCLAVDSINNAIHEKQHTFIDSIYNQLKNWAKSHHDDQLEYLLTIKYYFSIIYIYPPDATLEKNTSRLLAELDKKKHLQLKAELQQIMAEYYWENKNYASALENYIYAYNIYSAFSFNEFPHKADFLYDFGNRYYYFRDLETAKRYYLETWQTVPYKNIPNPTSKLNTLGLVYYGLDNLDSSNYYYEKAQEIAEKNNDELWVGIISGNLSNNYLKQKKYDEAIALIEKNIAISEKHHQLMDLATSYSSFGELLLIKKENKRALEMELKSLEIIKQRNLWKKNSLTTRIYPNIAKAYAANGNMALAYAFYDSAYTANIAWQKERNAIIVSGVQHKIDVEKHQSEIQKSTDEIKHQKLFRNSLLGGFLIMLVSLVIFFYQQRKLRNTNTKLIQSEKMALLGQLAASIAHEVNTPLGAIKSSAEESINAFPEILTYLSWFVHTFNDHEKKLFIDFLVSSNPASQTLSTKEEREIKKKMRDKFAELGDENKRFLSDNLVHVGIYEITPSLEKIVTLPHFDKLMTLAYHLLNQQRSNQTVHLAVDKASRIVKALKTYMHTSASGEMEAINLRDNIELVLTIYHNRLKQGVQVLKNYEDVPPVFGYPDQLNQVWTNLIVNAVHAMDNKGILTIGINQEGNSVIVSIKDTGKGIPTKIHSKIFDPFFTTKNSGEGSGLGLGIIKRIVEEHSAKISFQSAEGEGTTFYVILPINK
jgi:signal transduction histidine kinase